MKITSIVKRNLIHMLSIRKPEEKILFSSFGGTQYSVDPRAISEKMHEMFPDYALVWVLNSEAKKRNAILLPDYIRVVEDRIDYIKELATSAVFVTTEPLTCSFYKRKDQLVIQTWHGDRGMKKVLYEWSESNNSHREKIYDNEYTDLCIAASAYGEERYRKAFKYYGEILKIGMPRNDKLLYYNNDFAQLIKDNLKIPKGYKVLTYAPTFRGHSINEQKSEIDIERTLSVLEYSGEKWICLIRAHEYSKRINIDRCNRQVIDVSSYPDMTDILVITDMLITDYSSCAGDYILKRKPVVLAINDEEEYKRSSRSLCVDLEKTGFILSHSQKELEDIISTYTDKEYSDSCNKVLSFYGTIETGHASETICKIIDQHIKNTNTRDSFD